jgi:N-methylhydantoinase B
MPQTATANPALGTIDTSDVDLVDVEIFQRQLYAIANEMGLIMIRTSGDPTISEAVDFSTFIADAAGEIISFSGYLTWHFGPARQTVCHLLDVYPREEIHPGDAFICNDPFTGGVCHQPDVAIVRPIFHGDELVAWCWAMAHLLDVGGMAPGGFAPGATECYAEGLRFPGIKFISEGKVSEDLVRLIESNFRVPQRNLNDLRSFIAACNVCDDRLQDLLGEYGVETFRRYNEVSKDLSERATRKRIASLPDGVRQASMYVEHNGHVNDLYEIRLTTTVAGDSMTLDLTGTSPQTDGFVNMALGATISIALTPMVISLLPDVPINEGLIRAFDVIAPEGSIVNAVMPAPTSSGHVEAGLRLSRLVMTELAELQAASSDPFVRSHTLAPFGEGFAGHVFYAPNEAGEYLPFLDHHGEGVGGGAHPHMDGMDASMNLTQLQGALPDCEIYELQYPALYLWRRLKVSAGGAGATRGGQGVEYAFIPWRTEGGVFNCFTNSWQLPSPGVFGGYPGGTCGFRHITGADAEERMRNGEALLSVQELGGTVEELQPKMMGKPTMPGDAILVRVGGGGGYGDPLDREADAVARDLADGYIHERTVKSAYGVVLDAVGGVDADATAAVREQRRAERRQWPQPKIYTGAVPASGARRPVHPTIALCDGEGSSAYVCTRCETALAPGDEDYREYLCSHRSHAASRMMAESGAEIVAREGVDLIERACPGCGTLLRVDLVVDDQT